MDETQHKRQKIEHLSELEHCHQRPEMYIGAIHPQKQTIPVFDSSPITFSSITESPALISLGNELGANALDNLHRSWEQKYIDFAWNGTSFVVTNDGSALDVPPIRESQGHPVVLAFGTFRAGSNFDSTDTGKKEAKYTAGRNGIGAKGCGAFGTMEVTVSNVIDKRTVTVKWAKNMASVDVGKPTAYKNKTNRTSVSWTPDYERLNTSPANMNLITSWLAHNAALCAPATLKITYNGTAIKTRSPKDFCNALGATGSIAVDTVTHDGVDVLRIAVAARDETNVSTSSGEDVSGLTYAFVNSTWCPNGSHAKMIHTAVGKLIDEKANSKRGVSNIHCTPGFLRQHVIIVATVLVDNERFTSQTKTCLDTPVSSWGWPKWVPSKEFVSAIERSPIIDRIIAISKEKNDADAAKATKVSTSRHPNFSKYEPALSRGPDATLVACEGDSAANFVRSGLASVGKRKFGLYPLRGKFLNTRGLTAKHVVENKEAMELMKILGIQLNTTYTSEMVAKLPYGRLMVAADQDVDGSHIAGLVFNFIDTCAPSLLIVKPDYLSRFATSLIRVSLGKQKEEIGFYSQTEYEAWCAQRNTLGYPIGKAKYFKGLGTSSASLAKEYFRDLKKNNIVMRHTGDTCSNALDLAFNKKRADDRKVFLTSNCDPKSYVPYEQEETTLMTFVQDELLPQYALSTLRRAIPALDGFKDATRKVLFGARDLNLRGDEGISVANAAGKIASRTNYHHRGTAMEDTIIGMAADYTGTSNINLLRPLGQFGTRYKHMAASAAYPKVSLNDPIQDMLFPRADDPILTHIIEEGHTVEPEMYYPIIAMPLVMGSKGIATGWSTDIPQHHPVHVIDATLSYLTGATECTISPWYRGFDGDIVANVEGDEIKSYTVRGRYEWKGSDLHVTEVPPHREVEAYKEDWIKAEIANDVVPSDGNLDEKVHVVLKGCTLPKDTELFTKLGIEKRIGYSNMHLLNGEGKLTRYDNVWDIICDHASLRLSAYTSRIAHTIMVLERKLTIARNKALFIELTIMGKIDLRHVKDDEEAFKILSEHNLDMISGSYDYLLDMKMRSLTVERSTKLQEEADAVAKELEVAYTLTPEQEWTRELKELRATLLRDERYRLA